MTGQQPISPPPPYLAQPSQSKSSWWKYLLALIVGLAVGVGGYFGITALIGDSASQPATASTASTVSTPSAPSTPEKVEPTKSTSEKAKPEKPQKPTVALEKEFCSKPSGVCFNYPEGFKVTEDETPSAKENTWEWYVAKLTDRDGVKLIELTDSEREAEPYQCDNGQFSGYPPVEVIDSAPTKWKVEGADGHQTTAHAVKLVVAMENNEGSGFVYAPMMYVTTVNELFKPGQLPATCRIESGYSINIAKNSASIGFRDNDFDREVTYNTPTEAKQQLNDKRHQLAWEILQTVRTK